MNIFELLLITGSLLAATAAFMWMAVRVGSAGDSGARGAAGKGLKDRDLIEEAEKEVEHIFNDEFREELRNRGRLHFEKIIGENAMFLQQDLRLTTSQLNDFMKQEITRTLQEEFGKYEKSIADAKQLAIDSIQRTQEAIEQQRQAMETQLQKEVIAERQRVIERFEKNMADIVSHYIVAAIGNQIDLSDQLEYILSDLEANHKEILEDIKSGA